MSACPFGKCSPGELVRRSRIRHLCVLLLLIQGLCVLMWVLIKASTLWQHWCVCLAVHVLCSGFFHFWSSHSASLLAGTAKGNSSKQDQGGQISQILSPPYSVSCNKVLPHLPLSCQINKYYGTHCSVMWKYLCTVTCSLAGLSSSVFMLYLLDSSSSPGADLFLHLNSHCSPFWKGLCQAQWWTLAPGHLCSTASECYALPSRGALKNRGYSRSRNNYTGK